VVRTPRCWVGVDEFGMGWTVSAGFSERAIVPPDGLRDGGRGVARARRGERLRASTFPPWHPEGELREEKKKKMGGALAAGGARRWGAHLSAARLDATALARALEPEHRGEAVGHGGGGHRVRGVPASKIGRSELSTCLTDCRNSRSGRCERGYVGARVLSSVPRVRDPRAGIDTRS